MALTLSGTNGIVGAGFTFDPSGASVTAGVGTFANIVSPKFKTTGNGADVFGSGASGAYLKLINESATGNASHQFTIDSYNASNNYWNDIKIDGSNLHFNTYTGNRATLSNTALTFASGVNIAMASGNGIDFSATSDSSGTMSSELLDDYEEGTWTPVLTFGGGSTGITYANRGGNYTKIGRQVTVNFMVELSSKGSSTGDAVIGGLPYTIADLLSGTVIEASGSSSYWNNIEPDLMWLGWSASTSGNQLTPRYQPETGASDAVDSLSNSEFTNSTNFRGSITFFV